MPQFLSINVCYYKYRHLEQTLGEKLGPVAASTCFRCYFRDTISTGMTGAEGRQMGPD